MINFPKMNQENFYPKIEVYNRNPADFPEFISEYYLVMDAYNIKEEMMIKRLVLYLKGSVREIYLNIMRTVPPPNTWANLKTALEAKILIGDPQKIFRQSFYDRKQKSNENVTEFAYHIKVIAQRAFGEEAEWNNTTKAIVKDQWWIGINPTVRNALILYSNEPFESLVQKAQLIESSLTYVSAINVVNKSKRELICYNCQQPGHGSNNCPLKQNKQVMFKGESPSKPILKQNSNNNNNNYNNQGMNESKKCTKCARVNHWTRDCKATNLQCKACGKMGHVQSVCRNTNAQNYQNISKFNSVVRPQVNIDGKVKCHNCGQFGHMQRSCPKL